MMTSQAPYFDKQRGDDQCNGVFFNYFFENFDFKNKQKIEVESWFMNSANVICVLV